MRFGAHVSISKGLISALEKAQAMGANCIQIFSSSPRIFGTPRFTDAECNEFKQKAKQMDIGPNFIHAAYLVNLGSENKNLLNLSIKALVADLNFGGKIGARGVIVHTGSHKGKGFSAVLPTVVAAIQDILKQTHSETKLLLEIASGGMGKIGSTGQELAQMHKLVGSPRVGVCLDTAHLFAGGFAFDTKEKAATFSKMIESTIGWNEVECIHVNDSKGAFGSFIDRHENLGKGHIGTKVLKLLLSSSHFNTIPLILETPGFDDKGPDKQNLDILKSLV